MCCFTYLLNSALETFYERLFENVKQAFKELSMLLAITKRSRSPIKRRPDDESNIDLSCRLQHLPESAQLHNTIVSEKC